MARQRKREYEARRGTRRSARIDARDLTEAGDESSHNLQASSSGRKRKRSSSLQIHTDNAPAKLARTKDSTRTRRLASGASDSDRDEEPDQDDITASGSEEEIASGNGEEIAPAQSDTPPATQASHTLAGSGIFSTPVESFGESLADQAFVNRYAELSNVRESRPVAPQTPAGWFTPPNTQDTRTPGKSSGLIITQPRCLKADEFSDCTGPARHSCRSSLHA